VKTYEVDKIEQDEIKLVGFSITESLNHVLESRIVGVLREDLAKLTNEIENANGSGIYLLQIYNQDGQWTHNTPYQHIIALEVSSHGEIPADMITYTLPAGRFIKIVHAGAESEIGSTYEYINNTFGVRPIDIEYWKDIHSLENADSQIDIYIPADTL
jgi:predicted transcriptional regulator YdeE